MKDKFDISFKGNVSFISENPIMVPDYPFPSHNVQLGMDSIIVFNPFIFGISSIKYDNSKLILSNSIPIEQSKSNILQFPDYFFSKGNEIVFIQKNQILTYNKELEFENSVDLTKFNPMKNWGLPYFKSINNFDIGYHFDSFDKERDRFYFFSKDLLGSDLGLFYYDFKVDSVFIMPEFYNINIIRDQEVIHRKESVFTVDNLPFLCLNGNYLIASYYSNSKIDVLDLVSGKSSSKKINNSILAESKSAPPIFPFELSAFNASDLILDWEKEVAYSELKFWPNCDCFVRTVKGPSKESAIDFEVFVQIFNKDLELVQESNLSDINSDIGMFFLPLKDGILFKSKSQKKEDEYRFIDLSFN